MPAMFDDKAKALNEIMSRLGPNFRSSADLEHLISNIDSPSGEPAPAQPVVASSVAVESRGKLNELNQIRQLIRQSPITEEHYKSYKSLIKRYPELEVEIEAHFVSIAKRVSSASKIHVWDTTTNQSIINGIDHVLTKSGLQASAKISSCRAMLKEVTHDLDRKILEEQISTFESLSASSSSIQKTQSILRPSVSHCKVDPAINRAADMADFSVIIRVYWIARQLNIDSFNGSGYLPNAAFRTHLSLLGICTNKATYSRWLLDGEAAGFWSLERETRYVKGLYLSGIQKMAFLLLSNLSDEQLEVFTGNQAPGNRMVWVDCSGSNQEFRGNVLGAWLEQRSEDGVKISNERLAQLWGVTARTIQNRRNRVDIASIANYADGDSSIAPSHAVENAGSGFKWQMVNTYIAPNATRRHSHRGQASKVRKSALISLKNRGFGPAYECDGGQIKIRYFDGKTADEADKQASKAIAKRRADETIFIYQKQQRLSRKSWHVRYESRAAYTA